MSTTSPGELVKAQILSQREEGGLESNISNKLPSRASFLGSNTGSYIQKRPELGFMLYCHLLEILNDFTFELVFYK